MESLFEQPTTDKNRRRIGRKKRSINKGFFFRTGRGWYATGKGKGKGKKSPLKDELGQHLKDKADKKLAELAYQRWRLQQASEAAQKPNGMDTPIEIVSRLFLERIERDCAPLTFKKWAEILFSFCTGLRGRYRAKLDSMTPQEITAARNKAKKVCETRGGKWVGGFGEMTVGDLRPFHVTAFEQANPGWKSQNTRRTARTAIKQACTYMVEQGVIEFNPLAKMKIGGGPVRVTYFTEDQVKAVCDYGTAAYVQLFKFCLRTGARCGEFAKLKARHVEFKQTPKGELMVCTLGVSEHKTGKRTGKERMIRSFDAEIIAMVKQAIEEHPTGVLFHTSRHKPWTNGSICSAWKCIKKKIQAADIDISCDGLPASTHTTRHTFAKNKLWSGVPPQTVAILLGDTVEMILKVYGKWIGKMEDRLLEHI